jgi:cellobiose phosphorylase
VLLVEWILGARRSYEGLLVDPCLTRTIGHARVERTFRGARYEIELDNTAGRCRGARNITVDGRKVQGNVLPVFKDGRHEVQVLV